MPQQGLPEYVDAWCRRSANDQVTAEQAWKQQMSQPGPCGRDYNARQCCRSWHTQDGLLGACQLNDPIGAPSCARVDHFCAENHF